MYNILGITQRYGENRVWCGTVEYNNMAVTVYRKSLSAIPLCGFYSLLFNSRKGGIIGSEFMSSIKIYKQGQGNQCRTLEVKLKCSYLKSSKFFELGILRTNSSQNSEFFFGPWSVGKARR